MPLRALDSHLFKKLEALALTAELELVRDDEPERRPLPRPKPGDGLDALHTWRWRA